MRIDIHRQPQSSSRFWYRTPRKLDPCSRVSLPRHDSRPRRPESRAARRVATNSRRGPLGVSNHRTEFGRSSYAVERECSLSAVAGPIEHIADADHPAACKLIIATELTAASKAGTITRVFCKRSLQFKAAPRRAKVAADVASGPREWRRWRRYVDRSLPRKVSCRCLTCSQTTASNVNEDFRMTNSPY